MTAASGRSPTGGGEGGSPFVWAHRGASALAPENSIEAFLLAAEIGADGVELDVQLTADGVPVVVHDPFLWSASGELHLRRPALPAERLPVSRCRWEELESVAVRRPDGAEAGIPRLEAVLEAVPDWLWVDVEAKAGWFFDPRLAGVVLSCLHRRPERVLVSSFDHLLLQELARAAPELLLGALCDARLVDPVATLAAIPAPMLVLNRAYITEADAVRWRSEGLAVSVYGNEVLFDLAELSSWPLSGIFLDDPRLAASAGEGQAAPR